MTECPHCLETGNSCIVKKLDPDNQVKVEVVACKEPYLMVRYFNDGLFTHWSLTSWSVGMRIKYCPMCGRRLTDGN